MVAHAYAWKAIIFYSGSLFFSEVTERNSTKLCQTLGSEPNLTRDVQNLGVPPTKRGTTKLPTVACFSYDDIATQAQKMSSEMNELWTNKQYFKLQTVSTFSQNLLIYG